MRVRSGKDKKFGKLSLSPYRDQRNQRETIHSKGSRLLVLRASL
jgi:hypothetical protein